MVVAVELVGVVAGVAEHAPGPPRRGRRLQRGAGVAGVAGLEVAVGVHGDGIVARHSFGPVSLGELVVCFLFSGWERGKGQWNGGVRGRRRRGALYFGGRCGEGAGHFSFWPSISFRNSEIHPSFHLAQVESFLYLLHWVVQHQFISLQKKAIYLCRFF